jgi:tRNA(Ile)-lysidine synthase
MLVKAEEDLHRLVETYPPPWVIGVSGGADSLVLLHFLISKGHDVIVGHFHHGLRSDADLDEQFVCQIADQWGVRCEAGRGNTHDHATRNKLTLEAAGRELRYRFLFSLAEKTGASAVVTGHTADDQVETILMHMVRGSGSEGLQGMHLCSLPNQWSHSTPLLRPFLSTWRTEIEAYCQENNLSPRMDLSNLSPRFLRNNIRLRLIPLLEQFNPQIRPAIWRLADILREDYAWINQGVESSWGKVSLEMASDGMLVRLKKDIFLKLPLALKRGVLRKALGIILAPGTDIYYAWIERAVDAIQSGQTTQNITLGGGVRLVCIRDEVWFYRENVPFQHPDWPLLPHAGLSQKVPIPGELQINPHWVLRVNRTAENEDIFQQINAGKYTHRFAAWLQTDFQPREIHIRSRRSGDRFQPFGMGSGTQKVSDYFINQGVPAPVRSRWPLVFVGDELAWIPGFTVSEKFRVVKQKAPVIHLRFDKIS